MRHRPDIDGLRAVAVVPIVLFHAGLERISGGFIGVDILFVISGFFDHLGATAIIAALPARAVEAAAEMR